MFAGAAVPMIGTGKWTRKKRSSCRQGGSWRICWSGTYPRAARWRAVLAACLCPACRPGCPFHCPDMCASTGKTHVYSSACCFVSFHPRFRLVFSFLSCFFGSGRAVTWPCCAGPGPSCFPSCSCRPTCQRMRKSPAHPMPRVWPVPKILRHVSCFGPPPPCFGASGLRPARKTPNGQLMSPVRVVRLPCPGFALPCFSARAAVRPLLLSASSFPL